jgi:hypothetical protein
MMITFEEIQARFEIEDARRRYARGVDRRDPELMMSAYHHDAVDRRPYGPEGVLSATPAELAARTLRSFEGAHDFSQHHINNVSIDLDLPASLAFSECYVLAFHPHPKPAAANVVPRDQVSVVGGRYVDQWECRSERWAIVERSMVVDWSRRDLDGPRLFTDLAADLASGAHEGDPSWPGLSPDRPAQVPTS